MRSRNVELRPKYLIARALVGLVCTISSASAIAQGSVNVQEIMEQSQQKQQQYIESLKRGVVRIEAQKGVPETGTGFILSSTADSVMIATALHVVQDAGSISVYFRDDPKKAYKAKKLTNHSKALDLAVIEVASAPGAKVPADLPKYNFAANNTLQQTEHLFSVNGDWTIVENNVTRTSHDGDLYRSLSIPMFRSAKVFRGDQSSMITETLLGCISPETGTLAMPSG